MERPCIPGVDAMVVRTLRRGIAHGLSVRAVARALDLNYRKALAVAHEQNWIPRRAPRKPAPNAEQCARFVQLVHDGASVRQAGEETGISPAKGYKLAVESGRFVACPTGAGKDQSTRRRVEYLRLRVFGSSRQQAAKQCGIDESTAKLYDQGKVKNNGIRQFVPAGGASMAYKKFMNAMTYVDGHLPAAAPAVPQAMLDKKISDRYLSARDRDVIQEMLCDRRSQADIARALGRSRSTISREIKAHSDAEGRYRGASAHRLSCASRLRPRQRKLDLTAPEPTALASTVQDLLNQRYSPMQISRRLKVFHSEMTDMQVSHETIYQELYRCARGGLYREVKKALRSGRVKRKPRGQGSQSRNSRFKVPMVMISERPAEVETRMTPGHWEGDLIMGVANKSAIATLVERTSGYLMMARLEGGHSAEMVAKAVTEKMNSLPPSLKLSLTWDQGSEMALHHKITEDTGCQVYFCDPHSPWQRGTNENTNGLLRQYFPKGTDLSKHTEDDLKQVETQINNRPRERHGFLTPEEVLRDLLQSK